MSAWPPEHTVQFESQHGSVSTVTQLIPLGQTVPGVQSGASKQPAVKLADPQPGTSQRQPAADAHRPGAVKAEHGWGGEHGGTEIDHVPLGEHCAVGPHMPPSAG
jgi:hypothetical protein